MAERNPNIPSERRMEVEERTEFNENEANRRFGQKEAKLNEQSGSFSPVETSDDDKPDLPKESKPEKQSSQ